MPGKEPDKGLDVRLSANITVAERDVLRGYARRKGVSLKEATERAVRALVRVDTAQERGAVWVVGEPDGRARQVEFLL